MADKNQLKIDDQVDLADDDPFAELTRIMGFDPRQPAKQAQAPAAAPAPQEADEDDFSLDLEKELLGGFEFEDETVDPPVEAAAPIAEAPVSPEPDAFEAAAPEVDFDFSADFDAAIAASDEAGIAVEPETGFELGLTDLNLSDDDLAAVDSEAPQPVEFAAIEPEAVEPEADFDLGLTEDDVRALDVETPDFETPQPDAPAPAVEAFAADIDGDLDAAIADIDMDFLGEAVAYEQVAAAPAVEPAEASQADAAEPAAVEDDLHLFDEDDFRLDEEPAAVVEPEQQPELDANDISFGEDEFRLDDVHPAEDLAVEHADEFTFDDVDFAAGDLHASEVAADPEPVVAEPSLPVAAEPVSAPSFEFAIPPYVPRKLPVSPMDVAAEEFRQREAVVTPAEPEFNLEDELNALLGNIKASQVAAAPAPEPVAPAYEPQAPVYEQPAAAYEPPAYEPPAYEAIGQTAYEPESPPARQEEIVSFDAPEHPVDIDDDLKWELDDAFASEAAPEPAGAYRVEDDLPGTYADEYQPEAYAEQAQYGAYDEAAPAEDGYAAEEPAPLEFEDDAFDLSADDIQPEQPAYYGDALASAAIGAVAASRFDSGFASRPFEAPRAYQPERFAPAEPETFSPHRDPVVRGNPLKEDPLDVITALAAKYSKKEPVTPYGRAMGVVAGTASSDDYADDNEDIDISAAFEEQPDVETIEVADRAIALADDLDIPELAEEDELPAASAYDDLDAEFSSLLSDMNAEPRAAQPAAGGYDDTFGGGFNATPYRSQMTAAAPGAQYHASQPARQAYDDDPEPDSFALDADDLPGSRMPSGAQFAADEYDYDPDLDQEIAAPHQLAAESRQPPKSRGMLLAALVGGVALVGAIGAFALSFGDGSGDTPAIVMADDGPVKVKPENPGGTTVPNQDNKVYETVAGEGAAGAPQQEKLVTTAEEPVDVTPPPPAMEDTAAAPSGKSEDRIEQILQDAETQTDAEIVAVAPRKVRTMVVKPDGTLVPREDEPQAAPSNEQTDTVAAAVPEAVAPLAGQDAITEAPEATGALPAEPETAAAEAPLPPDGEQVAAATPSEDRGTMPETAPIAPLRPADQPIDVVGEVTPDQVAATTTTAAASGGSWAMQIASQPSEAAAQSSYQDLARRYGGVLQGREVNIVKAEIAGKGTFWRVRVPANSRNEAIGLCENYKAAGGNCFVSR